MKGKGQAVVTEITGRSKLVGGKGEGLGFFFPIYD